MRERLTTLALVGLLLTSALGVVLLLFVPLSTDVPQRLDLDADEGLRIGLKADYDDKKFDCGTPVAPSDPSAENIDDLWLTDREEADQLCSDARTTRRNIAIALLGIGLVGAGTLYVLKGRRHEASTPVQ